MNLLRLINFRQNSAQPPVIVTNGLSLHFDAGNPASYPGTGTTWTDLSGQGNNGTLINGVGYSSADNGFLSFDGINDFVDVNGASTDFVLGTSNFTAEVWVNFNSTGTGCLMSKHFTSAPQWFELRLGGSNKILTQVSLGGGWDLSYSTAASVTNNQWYSIVLIRSGSLFTTYINGVSEGTANSASSISNNTAYPFRVGARGAGDQPLNGKISVVLFYKNKALTASEIQQNYDAFRYRYGL